MWIRTDQEMPKIEDEVVFLEPFSERIDGTKHIGFFDGKDWIVTETYEKITFVSHWLKLPNTAKLIDEL